MSPDLLKYLIEQAIEEELEEANALGMGGVVGNATLAAGQKPDHSILWSGDEPLKEQSEPSSLQDMLQAALANVAGSSISLDQLIKLGKVPELRSVNRLQLRRTLSKMAKAGQVSYQVSLVCDGKKLWSGQWEQYEKLSSMKLSLLRRKCGDSQLELEEVISAP